MPSPAPSDTRLTLRAGSLHAELAPAVGGSIARFSRRWREAGRQRELHWLRPAPDIDDGHNPLAMASFPLLPFCNRIRGGRASFGGREIRFPPNHPAEDSPHPLHGIGWQRHWIVDSVAPSAATLSLQVTAGHAWPWSFSARQTFDLRPECLCVELVLRNEDAVHMPAGVGHHLYFPQLPGTRLTASTQAMWEADQEVMPTALAEPEFVRSLRQGVLLSALNTDNNFVGWSRSALIEWPADDLGPARSLLLQADSPLDYFVLYCQQGFDHFCAEPVSQCTDWLNLLPIHGGQALGGARLAPGETLVARMELTPSWP